MSKSIPQSKIEAQDLAYIAVFAAVIIVLGFVSIPVGAAGVPIVMQNAACILAALVLGPKRGTYTVLLFLLIGLALPVLAGGRTVVYALGSPTIGYLVGYIASAFVAGLIAYRASSKSSFVNIALLLGAGFAGLFLQYCFGVFGLMARANMTFGAAWAAQLPFVIPDTAKVLVIVFVAFAVRAALPSLRRA